MCYHVQASHQIWQTRSVKIPQRVRSAEGTLAEANVILSLLHAESMSEKKPCRKLVWTFLCCFESSHPWQKEKKRTLTKALQGKLQRACCLQWFTSLTAGGKFLQQQQPIVMLIIFAPSLAQSQSGVRGTTTKGLQTQYGRKLRFFPCTAAESAGEVLQGFSCSGRGGIDYAGNCSCMQQAP